MEKSSITKGPVVISGGRFEVRGMDGELLLTADHKLMRKSRGEREANIALAAEAFNVMHQAGLSPRELLAQRDELAEALRILLNYAHGNKDSGDPLGYASMVLSKIKPKVSHRADNTEAP